MTPLQAVRKFCLSCVENSGEVENCTADGSGGFEVCVFHPYRFGKNPENGPALKLSTFRKFCLWCMGGDRDLVEVCNEKGCFIHPYRLGHNPARKGLGRKGGGPENWFQKKPVSS